MFYSLQEVAEKIGVTDEQVQQLVKEGKLREFRDGPNLLFKVDEVEAYITTNPVDNKTNSTVNLVDEQETGLIDSGDTQEIDQTDLADNGTHLASESASETISDSFKLEAITDNDETSEILLAADESIINLEDSLTNADTIADGNLSAISDNMNILADDSTNEMAISDDTLGGTQFGTGTSSNVNAGSGSDMEEMSISEIEDDISLDSFGSGSGLLDLSLQADDTSLGGILDEIYTPEEDMAADANSELSFTGQSMMGSVMGDSGQAMATRQSTGTAFAAVSILDPTSTVYGIVMLLPLMAIIYTITVAIAEFCKIKLTITSVVQPWIWYAAAAMAGASILILLIGLVTSGGSGKPKTKKVKKTKAPKQKKMNTKKK